MSHAGLPPSIWATNVAAAAAGFLGALLTGLWPALAPGRGRLRRWALATGLALLGATLLAPGVAGVHRWLPVGPLQVHASAVLLPPLLVVLADVSSATSGAIAILTLALLLLQPDLAQAASFAAGWAVMATGRIDRRAIVGTLAAAALAAAVSLRPDPLAPVPHVEGIIGLAAARGLPWAAAAVVSLAIVPLSLVLGGGRRETALAAYAASAALAGWTGHHPVPMVGYGVSPIVGYYAALWALRSRSSGGAALRGGKEAAA